MNIIKRLEKGAELTYGELDNNFTEIEAAINEKVDNSRVLTDVPENALFTDTIYDDSEVVKSVSLNGGEPVVPDENGNTNLVVESGGRFGVAGEDDIMTSDRTVTGSNDSLNLNSVALNLLFEDDDYYTEHNINKGSVSLVIQEKINGQYQGYGQLWVSKYDSSIAWNNYNSEVERLCEVRASAAGILLNIDENEIMVPEGVSGTIPMSVNGQLADANGNIVIDIPDGGVKSVSVNGGEPVLPVEGNVDLTVEGDELLITDINGNISQNGGAATFGANSKRGFILSPFDTWNTLANITGGTGNTILNARMSSIEDGWSNCIIGGTGNTIAGSRYYGSIIGGSGNTLANNESVIMGTNNYIGNDNLNNRVCFAMGHNNHIEVGNGVSAIGLALRTRGMAQMTVGQANVIPTDGSNDFNNGSQKRFVVGNGTLNSGDKTANTRSNAFEVYQNGNVIAPSLTITNIDSNTDGKVLLTKEYVEANYIKKPTAVYADNAGALAGGLSVGETYRTSDGTIKIVF